LRSNFRAKLVLPVGSKACFSRKRRGGKEKKGRAFKKVKTDKLGQNPWSRAGLCLKKQCLLLYYY